MSQERGEGEETVERDKTFLNGLRWVWVKVVGEHKSNECIIMPENCVAVGGRNKKKKKSAVKKPQTVIFLFPKTFSKVEISCHMGI